MRVLFLLSATLFMLLGACKKDHKGPDPATLSFSAPEGLIGGTLFINILGDSLELGKPTKVTFGGVELIRLTHFHEMHNKQIVIYAIPAVPTGPVEIIIENNGKTFSSSEFKVLSRAKWDMKANLAATNLRYGPASFVIGNKAYVGTGADYLHTLQDFNAGLYNLYGALYLYSMRKGSFKNDWLEYDPATDQWTSLPAFPGGLRYGAIGFAIGNKGYVGLGHLNDGSSLTSTFYNDMWEYDPAIKTWTKLPDFPGNARSGAIAFSINNNAYVALGNNNNVIYKDVWKFDATTKNWTKLGDFPGAQTGGSASVVIGQKGYVLSGSSSQFWEYAPSTDTWTRKTDIAGPNRTGASGFTIGNKAYFGGGHFYDDSQPGPLQEYSLGDFWEYDPATNAWLQLDFFGPREAAYSFAIGNNGYVGGGIHLRRSGNHRIDAYLVNSLYMFTRK